MAKIDLRRNYYADLGLQTGADAEEIKKQFRKLALQLHPDRNPGRESEFIAKFQVIQSANEILSDPVQREKYDADRGRASYGKTPAAPKSSTSRAPQKPKPQPARTPFTPRRSERAPDPAGAQRYSTFRAGPRPWPPKEDANTRADAYEGFSGMRNRNTGNTANTGASTNGWQSFDPKTGATPNRQHNKPFGQRSQPTRAENEENTRPRSAYERTKDSANTTRPAQGPNSHQKRQGFAPGVPGGDEPMARGTSNYTSSRPTSAYYSSMPSPTAKKPEPLFPEPPRARPSSVPNKNTNSAHSSPLNPQPKKYHKSNARPKYKHSSDGTSSSDMDSDDESAARNTKPKAVPISRLGKKTAGVFNPETDSHFDPNGTTRGPTRLQQFNSKEPKSEAPGQTAGGVPAGFTPFQPASFHAEAWAERLRNMTWSPEGSFANARVRSPPRVSKNSTKPRTFPPPASVTTEAEEAAGTVNSHAHPTSEQPNMEAEAMDVDMDTPDFKGSQSKAQHAFVPPPSTARMPTPSQTNVRESHRPIFNLGGLGNTAPFAATNNGGINDLGDIHTTLPFQSKAEQPKTNERDIRPRSINLPNPPKRPSVPIPVSPHPGTTTKVLDIRKWKFYVSAMETYMKDWNIFNRGMVQYFAQRQEANETGLSRNWITAIGDSLKLDIEDEDDDLKNNELQSHKGGIAAYLRGIEEDLLVRKHWEVAVEMHREAILDLGRLREWIKNGGSMV